MERDTECCLHHILCVNVCVAATSLKLLLARTNRLTQVTSSGKKVVRRVFVNAYYGILTWEKEAIFGTKWERVKLAEAWVSAKNRSCQAREGASRQATFTLHKRYVSQTRVANCAKQKERAVYGDRRFD